MEQAAERGDGEMVIQSFARVQESRLGYPPAPLAVDLVKHAHHLTGLGRLHGCEQASGTFVTLA